MNPAGRVIYIGKGTPRRARDLSPSRRTAYHLNAIRKHCAPVLVIVMVACVTEAEAFEFERKWIAEAREAGHKLANFTDGGEGASGRKKTHQEIEALRNGTLRQWDTRGRKPPHVTPSGVEHCQVCGADIHWVTRIKKICGRKCANAKYRAPYVPSVRAPGKSGVRGVYPTPHGKWMAGVTSNKVYRHLGTFPTIAEAVEAREKALREG